MKKGIIFLIFLLAIITKGYCQNGVNVYCSQVNPDGSTTIYYQTITGNNFIEYIISAYSLADDSYIRVGGENNINVGSYTDHVRNANTEQVDYLITADFGQQQRPYGNIKTIYLTANQISNNVINLSWTSPGASIDGLNGQQYKVYRKQVHQSNTWQQIKTLPQTTRIFSDTIPPVCSDSISYKIEIENTHGCFCRSNEVHLTVGDTQIPDMPTLNTCSVNLNTQKIELSWTPSTANDVYGYVVCKGNPCVALDTIWGKESNFYTCNTCSIEEINSLAIMSFDTCFNTSLRTDAHNNMVLKVKQEPCSDKMKLTWNEYINMPSNVLRYDVYRKMPTESNYVLITNTTTNSCDITTPIQTGNCDIYVEAVANNGLKAKSNLLVVPMQAADTLTYLYLRTASVERDNKKVTLRAYLDSKINVNEYKLFRAKDASSFEYCQTIPYSAKDNITITDNLPEPANEHTFSYYLQAPDGCNLNYTKSNKVTTMKLNIEQTSFTNNHLTWTPFVGWQVLKYEIYRFSEGSNDPLFVGTTNNTTYDDDVLSLLSAADKTYYYIKAIEKNVGPDNNQENAISSYNYIKRETLFFIPNAFIPKDGSHIGIDVFKPECHFIRNGSYQMKIYNRWGELMFSTNNQDQGWDGKYKGEYCPQGTYIYRIQYINSQGKQETKGGAFALID